MFNTTNNENKTEIKAPATGIIQKSNINSYFIRMHQTRDLARELFVSKPKHNDVEVVILQVLLTHENWFLVEFVPKDDL